MKKIAVTGGLSSGKTQVLDILQSLGAYVVNSDRLVHSLLKLPSNVRYICEICGHHVLVDGSLDREEIANIVFSDPLKLKKLETLLHAQALEEIKKEYEKQSGIGEAKAFVVEAPLLFEAKWESFFDEVVLIISLESLCRERYIQAGHSAQDFERRRARQYTDDQKRQWADRVIHNGGSLEQLREETIKFFTESMRNLTHDQRKSTHR